MTELNILARHVGQTPEERDEQERDWFSPDAGRRGHLLELGYQEPFAVQLLCYEAIWTGRAAIPASRMRKRLPEARRLAAVREAELRPEAPKERIQARCDNYTAFVEYCERIEAMTGEPVHIEVEVF